MRHLGTQTFCGASFNDVHVESRPGQSMSPSQVCVHIPSDPPDLKTQKSLLQSALSLHCAPYSFFSVPPLEELELLDDPPLDDPPLDDPPDELPPLDDPLDELPPPDDPPEELLVPSSLPLQPMTNIPSAKAKTPKPFRMVHVSWKSGVRRRRSDDAAQAGP